MHKLLNVLYDLCQEPRAWYAQLSKCLKRLGFTKSSYEHSVYTRREGKETLVVGVYVDDLLPKSQILIGSRSKYAVILRRVILASYLNTLVLKLINERDISNSKK